MEFNLDDGREVRLLCRDGLFGVAFPCGEIELWQEEGEPDGWFLHRVEQLWQGLKWVGETDGRTIPGGSV